MRNLYDVLGVPRDAPPETIKKSFKKLARRFHPDVSKEANAEERFKEVNAAYAVLSDEQRRKDYDEFGEISLQAGFDAEKARAWRGMGGGFQPGMGGMGGGVSLDELLGNLFGSGAFRGSAFQGFDPSSFGGGYGGGRPRRGRDLRASIQVDLLTAVRGGEVPITISGPGGERRLNVKLPRGVSDGQTIRLRGQAGGGQGGPAGDVLLEIKVGEHPALRREGDDLFMEVPVTFAEVLAGAKISVPTPWGDVVVKVPPGGGRLRLKGKGIQHRSGAGDLYLEIRPAAPPKGALSEEQAAALAEQLAALYPEDVRAGLRL
jgi:curved DNA-binding protein